MSRKQMVAMPLIITASCGLSPMTSGKTNVAPNIATTCWAPRPIVRVQDRRSSGRTTSPGGGVLPPCTTRHPTRAMTPAPLNRDDRRRLGRTDVKLAPGRVLTGHMAIVGDLDTAAPGDFAIRVEPFPAAASASVAAV